MDSDGQNTKPSTFEDVTLLKNETILEGKLTSPFLIVNKKEDELPLNNQTNTVNSEMDDTDVIDNSCNNLKQSEAFEPNSSKVVAMKPVLIEDNSLEKDAYDSYNNETISKEIKKIKTVISKQKYRAAETRLKFDYSNNEENFTTVSHKYSQIEEVEDKSIMGFKKIYNTKAYLHEEGLIGFENMNVKGPVGFKIVHDDSVLESEAFTTMLDMLFISPFKVSVPLLLSSLMAVTNSLWRDSAAEIKTIQVLVGVSGTMKTTLAKLYSNIFNLNKHEDIDANCQDTTASLDVKFKVFKDYWVQLDDLFPPESYRLKNHFQELISKALRNVSDRTGKAKAGKDLMGMPLHIARCNILITSEDFIKGHSNNSRITYIKLIKGQINKNKLTYHQNNRVIYSTSIYNFLKWIGKDYYRHSNYIRSRFVQLRQQNENKYSHDRFIDTEAQYHIMIDILLQYMHELGLGQAHGYSINQLEKIMKESVSEVISENDEQLICDKPHHMYLTAVQSLLNSQRERVIDVERATDPNGRPILGYETENHYMLLPEYTYQKVLAYYRSESTLLTASKTKIHEALDNAGIIETAIESRDGKAKPVRTLRKKMPYQKSYSRYLIIRKNMMSRELGV